MLAVIVKRFFTIWKNFWRRANNHPSEVETVWERQNFLRAVRGGGARPAQGVGVGAANSRGERWVKICVTQAFREVFNITDIMLSKKQGRQHARDLNGVIPRAVLPKGHKRGAPLRCFARLAPIRPRRPAAIPSARPLFPCLELPGAE